MCGTRWVMAALVVAAAATSTSAQVVTEMTPDRIKEAIASAAEPEIGNYKLPHFLGFFSTPYSRVAGAARAARKKYQPFTEADVTKEMLAPDLEACSMFAYPALATCPSSPRVARLLKPVKLVAMVVMPVGATDPALAVRPVKTRPPLPEVLSCGSFPLAALREGNEIRFVFEGKVCCGDIAASECVFPFKLSGVK